MRFWWIRASWVLGAVLAGGLMAGSFVPGVAAQQPPLDVVEVVEGIHLIAGDGGNIVVQSGTDGTVLVDSGTGTRADEVLEIVGGLSSQPIRYIINTTVHHDFVGGNGTIAANGVPLGGGRGRRPGVVAGIGEGAARLAHENVLLRMASPGPGAAPYGEALWPTEGFIDRKDFYLNGEAIQVIHQPAAYADGDSIVFFRRSDVIATGPIIDDTRFPEIDVAAGGSVEGLIDALNVVVQMAVPPTPLVWQPGGTQVVPGRGRVMEQADVLEYRDMVTIVRDVVAAMAAEGMTLEQIQANNPTRGYNTRYGATSGDWTTAMFVEAVYRTMEAQ